ncbi:MAG: autotransporter domain-containing protein [Gammaproteobacteria bacterium]|nr:autotransporter domain-containing protein [Gammaproteobacteria bacterium]
MQYRQVPAAFGFKTRALIYTSLFVPFLMLAAGSGLAESQVNGALLVSPGSLSFNEVRVGDTSSTQMVTLTAQGYDYGYDSESYASDGLVSTNSESRFGYVTLGAFSVSGSADFSTTDNCDNTLEYGDSCQIYVVFKPRTAGSQEAQLIIPYEDYEYGSGIRQVHLHGVGVAATEPPMEPPTEEEVNEVLEPFAMGQPSAESTVKVISDACVSGRITERMQKDCNELVVSGAQGDPSVTAALEEITPDRATKSNQTSRQGGNTQSGNITNRLLGLRGGITGISLQGLTLHAQDQTVPIGQMFGSLLSGNKGSGASADDPLAGSRWGAFVTGDYNWGDKERSFLESGFDFDTWGITAGVDYRFTDQFVLGGAVGYMDTRADMNNNGGRLDSTGYSLSLYGTYYSEKDFFVDFSATYGDNDFDQNRRISYQLNNTVTQEASASYDGHMYGFSVGTGYDFFRKGWTFGPRLDLDYLKSKSNGFTERMSNPTAAGGGWATQIDGSEQEWLTMQLGGRASYAHSTEWGVVIPYGRLDWLHEFKDDAQVITGRFTNDPGGSNLQIFTEDPDRDYMGLRLGVSGHWKNGIVGFVDYGTILANSRWTSHTISAGLRMEF